jgi:GDP-L-fucose synthase
MLVERGAEVIVMDNFSRGQNADMHGAWYRYDDWDASDIDACRSVFHDAYAVFNLAAACGGVYFNMSHQLEQLVDNIKLQTAPIQAAVECGVKRFLQVSSVCVYPNELNDPAVEKNGLAGEPEASNAGYSWAKRIGEIAAHLAFKDTDTHYVIVRPTNMYGERDYCDEKAHVIPALIKKFMGTTRDDTVTV